MNLQRGRRMGIGLLLGVLAAAGWSGVCQMKTGPGSGENHARLVKSAADENRRVAIPRLADVTAETGGLERRIALMRQGLANASFPQDAGKLRIKLNEELDVILSCPDVPERELLLADLAKFFLSNLS